MWGRASRKDISNTVTPTQAGAYPDLASNATLLANSRALALVIQIQGHGRGFPRRPLNRLADRYPVSFIIGDIVTCRLLLIRVLASVVMRRRLDNRVNLTPPISGHFKARSNRSLSSALHLPLPLPRPAPVDLDLETEAQKRPDQHDQPEHEDALQRRLDRHRADDVRRDQQFEARSGSTAPASCETPARHRARPHRRARPLRFLPRPARARPSRPPWQRRSACRSRSPRSRRIRIPWQPPARLPASSHRSA